MLIYMDFQGANVLIFLLDFTDYFLVISLILLYKAPQVILQLGDVNCLSIFQSNKL